MKSDQKLVLECDFEVHGRLMNGEGFSFPGQATQKVTPYKISREEIFTSFAKDALETFLTFNANPGNGSEIEQLSVTINKVQRQRDDGSFTSEFSEHLKKRAPRHA